MNKCNHCKAVKEEGSLIRFVCGKHDYIYHENREDRVFILDTDEDEFQEWVICEDCLSGILKDAV